MDNYYKYINDGMKNTKETFDIFKKELGREDVFKKNIFIKNSENMYLEDEYGYIKIHIKTIPILALLNKSENTHIIITTVGKNNEDPLNKLNEEKSKYIYIRAYHELDEFIKLVLNDNSAIFGKEEFMSNDYYKIFKFKDGEKFLGINVNQEVVNGFIYDSLDYIVGKIKEKGSFYLKMEGFLKYFIIYDYEILENNRYKMIDGQLVKV